MASAGIESPAVIPKDKQDQRQQLSSSALTLSTSGEEAFGAGGPIAPTWRLSVTTEPSAQPPPTVSRRAGNASAINRSSSGDGTGSDTLPYESSSGGGSEEAKQVRVGGQAADLLGPRQPSFRPLPLPTSTAQPRSSVPVAATFGLASSQSPSFGDAHGKSSAAAAVSKVAAASQTSEPGSYEAPKEKVGGP